MVALHKLRKSKWQKFVQVINSYDMLPPEEQPWRLKEMLARTMRLWSEEKDGRIQAEARF